MHSHVSGLDLETFTTLTQGKWRELVLLEDIKLSKSNAKFCLGSELNSSGAILGLLLVVNIVF